MNSLLNNIKSKFTLKIIFDYISYSTCLKIVKGSRNLMQQLQITNETFKNIYNFKNITKSSYHIKKYFSYLEIVPNDNNEENYTKEKILCMALNISKFNVNLFVENDEWEYILRNFYKINLIISPNSLVYLKNLKAESQVKIYQTLNLYRRHITKITICYFNNVKWNLNMTIIAEIIDFLKQVFEQNIKDNNAIKNAHIKNNVKQFSFEFNNFPKYIDFIEAFFQKIDNIISLKKLDEFIFDTNSFDDFRFSEMIQFIRNKMITLKGLKINDFVFDKNNYADLNILFSSFNETIEKLDLSNSLGSSDVISVLNNKYYHLKELKLYAYFNYDKIDWSFLEKNANSLEVFQIEIKENKNLYNINQMIYNINKMKKLKNLKLSGFLTIFQLNKFKENENLEYLNIDLFIQESFPDELMTLVNGSDGIVTNFLKNFKNLKTLIIRKYEVFENQYLSSFIFPTHLTCIELINFRGECIKSLLNINKEYLNHIEELKIENSTFFDYFDFIQIFEYFKNQHFKKLSLNKILFEHYYDALMYKEKICSFLKNKVLLEKISSFLKNSHSLVELDISSNFHIPLFQKKEIFDIIKASITKKLLNLKIFDDDTTLFENEYIYFKNLFGFLID